MLNLLTKFATACNGSGFLGFPTWYKYLEQTNEQITEGFGSGTTCSVRVSGIDDIWLIGAAVIEILLRIAVFASIGFIIYGGVKYITSQGEPDKLGQALGTVINALIGLVISVSAATIISFVAGRF